ncbi:hypothetical protein IT570_04490 [Candidatus Sumerlaeota bacterium]|nr:hypothetical protein [Candidatus Sumerlaeota bacterium]
MASTLCELTLPASPESLHAFEELAHGLVAAHPGVLATRRTAIMLGVDITARRALSIPPRNCPLRLVSLAFSCTRSLQQLVLSIRCSAEVMSAVSSFGDHEFANLKAITSHRLSITRDPKGVFTATIAHTPRLSLARTEKTRHPQMLSPQQIDILGEFMWLYMLAMSWKRVEYQFLDDDEAMIRLIAPRATQAFDSPSA